MRKIVKKTKENQKQQQQIKKNKKKHNVHANSKSPSHSWCLQCDNSFTFHTESLVTVKYTGKQERSYSDCVNVHSTLDFAFHVCARVNDKSEEFVDISSKEIT